ncbi:MAG: transcription factor FapR [Firmicutes bacterium]|nr:transcription factor FapR [Bacillota bacterium]
MAGGAEGVRAERLRLLKERLSDNPFFTDEELAQLFGVSVQTIRLDRMALGIPELRQRIRAMAERAHGVVRSLGAREIVGEIVDIELNSRGVSILETTEDMALERTGIVRGHYIFAQADSLAIAIIDSDVVLMVLANSKFKRPVRVGERLVAKAEVIRTIRGCDRVVQVVTRSGDEQVFRGKFVVSTMDNGKWRIAEVNGVARDGGR